MAELPSALIIGGGTGIGYASAQRLLDRGCAVVIAGRRESVLRDASDRLGEARVSIVAGDAAVEAEAEAIVEAAAAALGDVGVYVNCAGVYTPVRFEEMREAAWRDTIGPTLDAQVFPAVAMARAMKRAGGGRMVLMSSISDPLSEPESAHYSAAKTAVSSLARSEVARVVEFLALDAPSYLTATTLYVDGGQTAMAMLP